MANDIGFPHVSVRLFDENGRMTREGLMFLQALWNRTPLTDYVTEAELTAELASYATIASLAAYATDAELTAALASYVTTSALTTTLASYAELAGGNSYTGAQTVAFQSLTDATNIATDASLSNNFRVTLGGNRTLDNPTNLRDGGCYNWYIKQDGTGSRTLAFGSKFKFTGSSTISTAAGARDLIAGIYDATDDVILCALSKGFA